MNTLTSVRETSHLDLGAIWEALLIHPESYVNFGEYWWTLKLMIADWAEENDANIDANSLRDSFLPRDALEVTADDVYNFLDGFSGYADFMVWISFVNPRLVWQPQNGEEGAIEDPEWEENFL